MTDIIHSRIFKNARPMDNQSWLLGIRTPVKRNIEIEVCASLPSYRSCETRKIAVVTLLLNLAVNLHPQPRSPKL